MPNPFNGSRHGKRGGSSYRASRTKDRELDTRPAAVRRAYPHHQPNSAPSTWNTTESAAAHWQGTVEIEETHETHGPAPLRKSLTQAQHLEARPERLEFEPRRERRIVRKWNGFKAQWEPVFNNDGSPCWVKGVPEADGWIENSRLVWKSDKTLLLRGDPGAAPKNLRRQTSRSKVVRKVPGEFEPVTTETPTFDPRDIERLNIDDNDY